MYLVTCTSWFCPLFLLDLTLSAVAEGGIVERHAAFALFGARRAQKLMLWTPKLSALPRAVKILTLLSQFCLQGSFVWASEPIWVKFQIPSSGYHPPPLAHFPALETPTRSTHYLQAGISIIITPCALRYTKDQLLGHDTLLPFLGGGRGQVRSWCFLLNSLFFISFVWVISF